MKFHIILIKGTHTVGTSCNIMHITCTLWWHLSHFSVFYSDQQNLNLRQTFVPLVSWAAFMIGGFDGAHWPQFNILHFKAGSLARSTEGYCPMPMWLNCGLKIYFAEMVMEEIALFIQLEIKKAILNYITLQDPALHRNIKSQSILQNTIFTRKSEL